MKTLRLALLALITTMFILACEPRPADKQREEATPTLVPEGFSECQEAVFSTLQSVLAQMGEAAQALLQTGQNFLQDPTAQSHKLTQQRWHTLHQYLNQYSYFIELSHTLEPVLADLYQVNHAIAFKQIQPGYLDAYGPYPYSGLVFELNTPITADAVRQVQQDSASEEGASGLFAIEFMLFGEADSRSHTDFVAQTTLDENHRLAGFDSVAELPNNRRRQLLDVLLTMLTDDIAKAKALWQSSEKGLQLKWTQLKETEQFSLLQSATAAALQSVQRELHADPANNDNNGKSLVDYPDGANLLKQRLESIQRPAHCLNATITLELAKQGDNTAEATNDKDVKEQTLIIINTALQTLNTAKAQATLKQ